MTLIAALAGTALAAVAAAGALPVDRSWGLDPRWDDGRAEVVHYAAHRTVYGIDRSYETLLITVKEDHDARLGVKADPPLENRDLITVLKMNIISHIATENYPYHYMTSVFVRRDDPRLLFKLAHSSQEWCGTTFKEIVTWTGSPRIEFHSYFDGQGDGRQPLSLEGGALMEEQLYLVMRAADLRQGVPYPFLLYDSLITNSARPPSSRRVVAVLQGEVPLTTPAGKFRTHLIRVLETRDEAAAEGAALLSFWIQDGGGRALVKMEASDGRRLLLEKISRRDYWSR